MISNRLTWKVSVIGQPGSGKSSLISRMAYDSDSAAGVMRGLVRKKLNAELNGETRNVEFLFQEIDGFSGSDNLIASANGVIIVVDITNPVDFDELTKFINFISNFGKKPLIFIAGSKLDRRYEAKIWEKDLEPLKKNGISKIYMVSSRQPETVKSMLNDVAASLLMRTMERK